MVAGGAHHHLCSTELHAPSLQLQRIVEEQNQLRNLVSVSDGDGDGNAGDTIVKANVETEAPSTDRYSAQLPFQIQNALDVSHGE